MRDITSIIMGDPGTHPRRSPTEREIQQLQARITHEQNRVHAKYSPLRLWPVGETRIFTDRKAARNAQTGLYNKGMLATLRTNKDGTITVRRIQ